MVLEFLEFAIAFSILLAVRMKVIEKIVDFFKITL
jgi:hypothetical protein